MREYNGSLWPLKTRSCPICRGQPTHSGDYGAFCAKDSRLLGAYDRIRLPALLLMATAIILQPDLPERLDEFPGLAVGPGILFLFVAEFIFSRSSLSQFMPRRRYWRIAHANPRELDNEELGIRQEMVRQQQLADLRRRSE